ncbi:MAG: hypothetical protein LQ351_007460 [Letrouitia transgressa]|nr:MAG: hypothetical protein LQ351_007460 [Letrouitia transgressa]
MVNGNLSTGTDSCSPSKIPLSQTCRLDPDEPNASRLADEGSIDSFPRESPSWKETLGAGLEETFPSYASSNHSDSKKMGPNPIQDSSLPAFLALLPIALECKKGAVVLGNQNTHSVLTAKFVRAQGKIDARNSQPIDRYKQAFDIDFIEPVIELKPNLDYKEPQLVAGSHGPFQSSSNSSSNGRQDGRENVIKPISHNAAVAPLSFAQVKRLFRNCIGVFGNRPEKASHLPSAGKDVPGENQWLGLLRYLDNEDVALNHERWKAIEYGQCPRILESPKVFMSLFWDVPGLVAHDVDNQGHIQEGPSGNELHESPPEWAIELRVTGGIIRYGPWADRMRADLQSVFFPSSYRDATTATVLSPGQPRISTEFKLVIEFDQETTLMIPTRESSKDWKWEDSQIVRAKTESNTQPKKDRTGKDSEDHGTDTLDHRPYGWLDMRIQPNSTLAFSIDLLAGTSGYRTQLDLDIRNPVISSSINHGTLLRSKTAVISCDLSTPLRWNTTRNWHVDIQADGVEIFLLRDHVFLFNDLINDWGSSSSNYYQTFVPFKYFLSFQLNDFHLFINVNDANIINNPSSLEENTFVSLWGERVVAQLEIPMIIFRPTRSQFSFDLEMHHGGLKFLTPTWSTQHAFLDTDDVAAIDSLRLDGRYDYSSTTSPGLADILLLNIHLAEPVIQLYGYVIRSFMKIKDNYFGDDIHFCTLEEYRSSSQNDRPTVSDRKLEEAKISSDLDVVLSVTADTALLLLPCYLYSSAESVSLDLPSFGMDLRFTNYYMELLASFSPVAISLAKYSTLKRLSPDWNSSTQAFVDGVEIFGHRLFGLPPTEPTYVCNWDFSLGRITGELSVPFLKASVSALSNFGFTLDDIENALPAKHPIYIPDVTFLRVRSQQIDLGLRIDEAAVLLRAQECKLEYNNWAGPLFSDRFFLRLPCTVLAIADISKPLSQGKGQLSLQTQSLVEGDIELRVIHENENLDESRQSQQNHLSIHDSKTNRTPWLLIDGLSTQFTSSREANVRPVLVPYPPMPEPLKGTLDTRFDRETTSIRYSLSSDLTPNLSRQSSFLLPKELKDVNLNMKGGKKLPQNHLNSNGESKFPSFHAGGALFNSSNVSPSYTTLDHLEQHDRTRERISLIGTGFGFSSPYKRPHFPLEAIPLDLSEVPTIPKNPSPADSPDETGMTRVETISPREHATRTSFMLTLDKGLRIFSVPHGLIVAASLMRQLQLTDPVSLLDQIQIRSTTSALKVGRKSNDYSIAVEFGIHIPFLAIKFVDRLSEDTTKDLSLSLGLKKVLFSSRSYHKRVDSAKQTPIKETWTYLTTDLLTSTIQPLAETVSQHQTYLKVSIASPTIWVLDGPQLIADAQCQTFEISGAIGNAEFLSLTSNCMIELSQKFRPLFSLLGAENSRSRFLLLALAARGEGFVDPPFLTHASNLLRSVEDHLRSFDSWVIISRLRHIHQSLLEEQRTQLRSQCSEESSSSRRLSDNQAPDMLKYVSVWGSVQATRSILMQEVFGSWIEGHHETQSIKPFKGSFRAGDLRLVLGPKISLNTMEIGALAIHVAVHQFTTYITDQVPRPEKNLTLQLYCAESAIALRWSFLEMLKDFTDVPPVTLHTPRLRLKENITVSDINQDHKTHIIVNTGMTTVSLESINVRATCLLQGIRGSLLQTQSDRQQGVKRNLLLSAHSIETEIHSQARTIVLSKLILPSLFGNFDDISSEGMNKDWHFAACSSSSSFEVREGPLEVLQVAENLITTELRYIQGLVQILEPNADFDRSSTSFSSQKANGRPHVAVFLDTYLFNCTILPALSYQIKGEVARLSMQPKDSDSSTNILNFDLKDHMHAVYGHTVGAMDAISVLHIPSINGRFTTERNSRRTSIMFHTAIEQIDLDAAAVHSLLTTLNRSEIRRLSTSFKNNLTLLLEKTRDEAESIREEPELPQRLFSYDAHVTLAGLSIRTSTADRFSPAGTSQLNFELGCVVLKGSNRSPNVKLPELEITFQETSIGLLRYQGNEPTPRGDLTISATFTSTSDINDVNKLARSHQIRSPSLTANIYPESASITVEIINHLQESLKSINLTNEVKGLRMLRRATMIEPVVRNQPKGANDPSEIVLHGVSYALEMANIYIRWNINNSFSTRDAARDGEDLVLSFTKLSFSTRRDNAARLLIRDMQFQMTPLSGPPQYRSSNSALLPEVIFNVAYVATATEWRIAFQAVGKPLDLRLTSHFMLPASSLRRSIATAINELRAASESWRTSSAKDGDQEQSWLGRRHLASLLVDADFAGAVVHLQGLSNLDPQDVAPSSSQGPQIGHYGQPTHDNAGSNTTLRAPGVAFKVEYVDSKNIQRSLNAEIKVDASSNTIYPTIVPLIMEISSSVKKVVSNSDVQEVGSSSKGPPPSILSDDRLHSADPSDILGNCKLNVGLQICRQEFVLSCQPIARVAATAHFDNIYVAVNTVQSADHGQFYALSATFRRLRAFVQHAYSRESTGNIDLDSIVVSLMNSRHLGASSGLSAITRLTPMLVEINAKQLQDCLLFLKIWLPPDDREPTLEPVIRTPSEPQALLLQRYQQAASAYAFPWNVTMAIAELSVRLDLGQSLGKSAFILSDCWISSTKSSNMEQNLCLSLKKVGIESKGRMSGFIELQEMKVRTSIRWPTSENPQKQVPLIQASLEHDLFKIKAAFDYQIFLIGEITAIKFLMYNVRGASGDRLVSSVDGGLVRLFCTTASASQGLALYQTIHRLIQEKQAAYEISVKELENSLRRKTTANPHLLKVAARREAPKTEIGIERSLKLQTTVFLTLNRINVGAFPRTFFDSQIFKLETLEISVQSAIKLDNDRLHSTLNMTLGQLRVALSGVPRPNAPKAVGDISIEEVIGAASASAGGTILKVPKVVASMQTWQIPNSTEISYLFKSSFQGKVDVGWNYSRISFLRGMWNNHSQALAQRLGKPLRQAAVQITTDVVSDDDEGLPAGAKQNKITAVVNVPQSKYRYTPLETPIIETPQLRDMGDATPPLEWIGLNRERLPNLTHQIVIVALMEVAKEVEDAYTRILGVA